ncbi:hypothetical protein Tco_0640743 [Tanacetum coccineum]
MVSDDKSIDTPDVSPFPHSDNDSDDDEVLNELSEYQNARVLRQERIINSFDRDDLAFQCMIGFRKFTAYLDPFLPMNIISRNFTYVIDFMIIEDISSIIDPRLSQVVLAKPFVEISNMTHDPPEGVVRFTNGTDEIAYKIEQYNLLSDLEREHTKSVYLKNEEDKIRGVKKFFKKNKEKIFTMAGDGVRINPDGITPPAM